MISLRKWTSVVLLVCILPIFGDAGEGEQSDATVSIGGKVNRLVFKDIRGVIRELSELGEHKAYVFVFVTSDCPIVKKSLPKLLQLYREFQSRDVQFVCVNVGANDTLRDVASQALEFQAPWPFVKDYEAHAAKTLGITRTPQVAVLNSNCELVYRGRVDDQFRLGGSKPNPSRDDLKLAIEELLAGKNISVPETIADGCAISIRHLRRQSNRISITNNISHRSSSSTAPIATAREPPLHFRS
jgi:hypothetical protein